MAQASKYYTSDVEKADAVYIDDYCLMASVTAVTHSGGFNGGYDYASQLYKALDRLAKTSA